MCTADGRVVIGAVNYGSLSVRLSRALYGIGRRIGVLARDERRFWDSPVPLEHTFECTYRELLRLGSQYADLEEAIGVSLGWGTPGWGSLLGRLTPRHAAAVLARLDAVAQRVPRWADYVLTVWRPRPAIRWTKRSDPTKRVDADDPAYRSKADQEATFWGRAWFLAAVPIAQEIRPSLNRTLTGDAGRSWLDDVVARGPFGSAAMLGCDDDPLEIDWMRAGASAQLDVYELSPGVIRRRRAHAPRGVRFLRADLNFVDLPPERYDQAGCSSSATTSARRACSSSHAGWHASTPRCTRCPSAFDVTGWKTSRATCSRPSAARSAPCDPTTSCRPCAHGSRSCTRDSPPRCSP